MPTRATWLVPQALLAPFVAALAGIGLGAIFDSVVPNFGGLVGALLPTVGSIAWIMARTRRLHASWWPFVLHVILSSLLMLGFLVGFLARAHIT